jgi:branched-subunit amino acid aminotransferase/4-amino-4-deoxychorismate lyase
VFRDGTLAGCQPLPPDLVVPFETMGVVRGALPLWSRHLDRLAAAASELGLVQGLLCTPEGLQQAVLREVRARAHDVVRLELAPAGASGAVAWRVHTRVRHLLAGPVVLVPTVARRAPGLPPPHLKALPRTAYDDVLAEARAAGSDDGIVVGDDGAVLETALGNLWLRTEGAWVTPALDGRVLPGIARAVLRDALAARGIEVVERRCDLADLHRATALAVSNAVHGPRRAVLARVRSRGESEQLPPAPEIELLRACWDAALAAVC